MSNAHRAARRLFLRQAATWTALGAGTPLAVNLGLLGSAAAQAGGDYKALVCLFLRGGNDSFNTVLATDADAWAAYTATRSLGGSPLALRAPGTPAVPGAAAGSPARLGGVLPLRAVNQPGLGLALHPALGRLKTLFATAQRLSVVANVGPLVVPTTKADLARPAHPQPPKLYSHNDQRSVWQAMAPEGATRGWGGRMGDLLAANNGDALFTAITTDGHAVWAQGDEVRAVAVTPAGGVPFGVNIDGRLYGSDALAAALRRVGSQVRSGNRLEADYAQIASRSLSVNDRLRLALPAADDPRWAGTGAAGSAQSLRFIDAGTGQALVNPLARQLQTVARTLAAARSGAIAARRQVFFVTLDGFDTHADQNATHAEAMAQLDHGVAYFDAVLGSLGLRQHVTLFTASEFGRTFTSNGDGTDHGWGGHHFVLGPALQGGALHGQWPTLAAKNSGNNRFDGSPDQLQNGALLPTTAVDQLAAALGRWFGLSDGQLQEVLPNLRAFPQRDPVFMA